MSSLMENANALISTDLHALVDDALKANSLVGIDLYIRKVENKLENLEGAVTTAGGEIRAIKGKLELDQQKAIELDRAVDAFLAEGDDDAAVASQSHLNNTNLLIRTCRDGLERLESEYQEIVEAKVKLQARHATMKGQRGEVQALLELAGGELSADRAAKGLDELMVSGDSEIRGIAQGLHARLDRVSAAAERRASSLDRQIDDLLERDSLDQQLAERKQKLGVN